MTLDETSRLVTTAPEISLGELANFLRAQGYTLPISACAPPDRSLLASLRDPIGCEATPAYGQWTAQCVAVSGALATGESVALSPAPRRAIGPDLSRLFLQASGSVVRSVTLRVLGRPEAVHMSAIACDRAATAFAIAAQLFAHDLLPADLWLVPGFSLCVRLAGKRQIVAAQANAIAEIAKTHGATLADHPAPAPIIATRGHTLSWQQAIESHAKCTHAAGFTPFGVTLFGDVTAQPESPLWQELATHLPGAAHGS